MTLKNPHSSEKGFFIFTVLFNYSFKKDGDIMKKLISITLFILIIGVFIFDLYFSITCAADVNKQFADLASGGAGGHELLGTGLDVLVFGVGFLSVAGLILSWVSWSVAQYRAIRIASGILCPIFFIPIFISACVLTLF